ncbi:conjugal transfer protein TraG N-terminal domain-containing protein [Francisellaceae bacterium]|nr:conjugal transfer protein TraG N-terminal domain-containing protein [Francisellaceae bacterium]
MTMPIYVFAGAGSAADMLNSVAIFMQGGGYAALIVIVGMIGVAMLATRFLSTGNYMQLFAWAALFLIAETLFLGTTTQVELIDATDQTSFKSVDGIPIGLAFMASTTSEISYGLAKDVAFAFQMPKDQEYSSTGFFFGSKLVNKTFGANMPDSETMSEWDHYTSQCILPDIALSGVNANKYTMADLNNSPNIFAFLANHHPSPLRGISMGGQFKTCQQSLPLLKAKFDAEADKSATFLGKVNYPDRKTLQRNIKTLIGDTYSYMFGMPSNAKDVLVQNMAINGIKQGLSFNAANNNAASALNYAVTQAQTGQTASYLTAGQMAETYIPEFQSVLFIFLIAMFPFIVLFAFLPEVGLKVIQQYIMGLVFIASLPVVFSVLHCLMMSYLQSGTEAYGSIYGGITLSNIDEIAYKNTQMAGIAGYMMSLTVFMTYIIVKGLASGLVQMSERLGGLANSAISNPAHAWTTGNLSMANSNISNMSHDNWNANKHDINQTAFRDKASHDTASGDTIDGYADGSSNVHQNTSSLRDSISMQQSVGAGLDHNKQQNIQATKTDQQSLGESVVKRDSDQMAFADRVNSGENLNIGMSQSDQASFSKAANDNENITQKVMEKTGYNHNEAVKALNGMDFRASTGSPGALKFLGGASATAGIHHSNEGGSTQSHDQGGESSQFADLQQSYQSNQQMMQSTVSDTRVSDMSGQDKSLVQNLNTDYATTNEASARVSADLLQQQSISQAIKETSSDSANINRNLNHKVWNDMSEQYGSARADEIINAKAGTPDNAIYQQAQKGYVADQLDSIRAKYGIDNNTFKASNIEAQHQQDTQQLQSPTVNQDNRSSLQGGYETSRNIMADQAQAQGVSYDRSAADQLKGDATTGLVSGSEAVSATQQQVHEQRSTLTQSEQQSEYQNKNITEESVLSPEGSTPSNNLIGGLEIVSPKNIDKAVDWIEGKL